MTETILDIPSLRKALHLTQSQLAEMAGVNLSTVWRWENGGVPKRGPARAFLMRLSHETFGLKLRVTSDCPPPDVNGAQCCKNHHCAPTTITQEGV